VLLRVTGLPTYPTYLAYLAGEADPAHPVLLCLEQEKHLVLPEKENKIGKIGCAGKIGRIKLKLANSHY
jgi:hypothetical protein